MRIITEPKELKTTKKLKKKLQLVKCPHCEQQVDRNTEPFVTHSKRYYHEACYNVRYAKIQARNNLIDYICYLYKLDKPNGFILKQIKQFEEDGYTLAGMQMTLQYFYEIKENSILTSNSGGQIGIGIIEYVYDDARAYFGNMGEIIKHNSKVIVNNQEEVICIKTNKKRKIETINLEGIE